MPIGHSNQMYIDAHDIKEAKELAKKSDWKPSVIDALKLVHENIFNIETEEEYYNRIIQEQQQIAQ